MIVFKNPFPPPPRSEVQPVGVDHDARLRAGVLMSLGGAIVMIGAFLPWLKVTAAFVGDISRSGLDGGGDGVIALGLGAAAIALGLWLALSSSESDARTWGILVAVAVGGLTFMEYSDVADRVQEANASFGEYGVASVGPGIYAMAVGAVLVLIGALNAPRKNVRRPAFRGEGEER